MDVLVSATAPAPPPKHTALTAPFVDADDVRSRFFFRRAYTGCYALTGAASHLDPLWVYDRQPPIGLQLGAGPFAEELLLGVAHAYEQATPWHTRRAPGTEGIVLEGISGALASSASTPPTRVGHRRRCGRTS